MSPRSGMLRTFLNVTMPAVSITATKVDSFPTTGVGGYDIDADGKADPGDKIRYTITITNGGNTDAANVVLQDTVDTNTTFSAGSLVISPLATNEIYLSVGNMTLTSSSIGADCNANFLRSITCNDTLRGATITGVGDTQANANNMAPGSPLTITGKGTVTLNADGTFVFNPRAGFEGTVDFWYTISNAAGSDNAKVSITVGGANGMVWFINNAAGGLNNGTQANPFTTLGAFAGVNNGAGSGDTAADANNTIFLYESPSAYSAPLTLLSGQKFIGQDSLLTFATIDAPISQPGNAYPPMNPGANIVSINSSAGGIMLNQNNTLSGFTLGGGSANIALQGTNFGTLSLSGVSINATGQAISLTTGTLAGIGSSTASFGTLSSSGGNSGISLTNVGGFMTATGGTLTGTATDATFKIVGGTVSVSYSGGITQAANYAAVSITGHATGTITFQTGTMNVTNGTGLRFDNADGTYNFNGITTLNGGDAGIDITNGSSGTFNFSASTSITSPIGVAFNVASSPGAPNVTYNGTITHNTAGQRAVNIDTTTGGSIGINSVTAGSVAGGVSNTGVNITAANGSVSFTTLNLGTSGTRMSQTAISIAGGSGAKSLGTVSIFTTGSALGINATNSTGPISTTTGTINTVGAAAANIVGNSSANRTPLNIQLTRVDTTGGANGIVLANTLQTGSPGGFNILGSTAGNCGGVANPGGASGTAPVTADCTGGQIQTASGATGTNSGIGILLTDVDKVSLTRVRVNGHSNFGVKGTRVNGFTLASSYFHNNGDDVGGEGEGNVYFFELTGSTGANAITNSYLDLGAARNLEVLNTSGTLDRLTVSGTTIGNDGVNGSDGIFIQADNSANTGNALTLKVTIQNGRFLGSCGDGTQMSARGTSITDFVFTGNRMTNNHTNQLSGSMAVTLSSGGSAGSFNPTNTFNISNNIINNTSPAMPANPNGTQGNSGPAISVGKGGVSANASFVGTISGNQIGTAGVPNSGSAQGSGIVVDIVGGGVMHATITNNVIRQFSNNGILALSGNTAAGGGTGNLMLDIRGNTIAEPSANAATSLFPTNGIRIVAGTNSGDNSNNCVTIGGTAAADKNTVTGSGTNGATDIRLLQRFMTKLAVPGYAGANNNDAAMNAFLLARNNATTADSDNNVSAGGPGYSGACLVAMYEPGLDNQREYLARADAAFKYSDNSLLTSLFKNVDSELEINLARGLGLIGKLEQGATTSPEYFDAPVAIDSAGGYEFKLIAGAHFSPNARSESVWEWNNPFVASAEEFSTVDLKEAASLSSSNEQAEMRLAHGDLKRKSNEQSVVTTNPALASPMSGDPININLGTLPANKVVKIVFDVTVTGLHPVEKYTNQGSITADTLSPSPLLTDDPDIAGSSNPTETAGDRYNTSIALTASPASPSSTGETITFTAIVSPTETDGTSNPASGGMVQFKDNGVNIGSPVSCTVDGDNCKAELQTSSLAPGIHPITAKYEGGTNHSPSATSNTVNYQVIACTSNPVVTTTADGTTPVPAGSLRAAIMNACPGSTITFNSSVTGFIQLATALSDLDKNLSITGPGAGVLEVRGNHTADSEIRVFNVTGTATVNISGLTITKGGSTTGGGGINIANGATLSLSDSAVTFNVTTVGGGGGILNAGYLIVERSTISNNTASGVAGGGILNTGTLTVKNSTISTNTVNGAFSGGGVSNSGTATFVNSTIANNYAQLVGGGIFSSGTTNIGNTIIAYTAQSVGGAAVADLDGSFTSQGNNWIQDKGAAIGLLGTDQSGDPQIQPLLSNNGGQTLTHAPLKGSPVVDGGSNTLATGLITDQRVTGFPRLADSSDAGATQTVDIGSIEVYPDIEDIGAQVTSENTQKQITFRVGDDQILPLFSVGLTSSDTTLVPNANITVSSTAGPTRTLTIDPATKLNGTTTITVTITASNGRIASDSFDLMVTEVNDAPVSVNDTVSDIAEDSGVYSIPIAALLTNDSPGPLEGYQSLSVTGVSNDAGGTVQLNGTNVEFTPTQNFTGAAGFYYTIQDNGTTAGAQDFKSVTGHVSFNITPVNDKPELSTSAGTTTFVEGDNTLSTPVAVDSALTLSDVDSMTLASSTVSIKTNLEAGEDVLAFANNDAAAFGNIQVDGYAAGVLTLRSPGATASLTQWQNALRAVTYTNSSDAPNTSIRKVSFEANDGSVANNFSTVVTKNVSVSATNDTPTLTNLDITVNEGSNDNVIIATKLKADDLDNSAAQLVLTVNAPPSKGTLRKSGVPLVNTSTFTQDDINNNLVTYDHDGSDSTADSFTFTVSDGAGGTIGTTTFNITVMPQNDVPTIAANTSLTTVSGATVTVDNTKLLISDPDNTAAQVVFTLGTAPAHGTLKKSGSNLSGGSTFTQDDINNNRITFTHNGDAASSDSFTFTVSDGAGGTIGTTTFNISINCMGSTVVTNTSDSGPGSLREAIITSCSGSTITFDIPTDGSDPGYDATNGVFTVTLTTSELLIDRDLTIAGAGANALTIRRSATGGTPRFRIFETAANAITVNLTGMTITNGHTADGASGIAGVGAGAILNNASATLMLRNVSVSANRAGNGGGGAAGGLGGGIMNLGQLKLINSTVSDNTAGDGGANAAGGNGGGIYNSGTMTLINTTLSGNTAGKSTSNATGGDGGGIYNDSGMLNLINVTISSNRTGASSVPGAGGSGGGIRIFGGTANLRNSIISGNLRATGGQGSDASGAINSLDYNLISSTSGASFTGTTTHNILDTDAHLGALTNNGGQTQTVLPLPGSPALGAGDTSNLPSDSFDLDGDGDTSEPLPLDQRGFPRVVGVNFDIGAVEANYTMTATLGTPQSTAINTAFVTNLKATVRESNVAKSNLPVTFSAPNSGPSGTFPSSSTVITDASGVATAPDFTANGLAGGPYNVTASLTGGSPSAVFSLTNTKANQTINFGALVDKTFGGAPFSVSATASSGLAVSFSSTTPTVCSVEGNTVTIVAAGTCTVTASQGGNNNFNAAPNLQQSYTINMASSTTTITVSNTTFDGQPHGGTASVTGAGGLNQSLIVTYTGRNSTTYGPFSTAPTNAGDYTASATFAGDANYNGSNDSKDFSISKASQTITFNALTDKTFGDVDFPLNATTTATGLNVSFAATGQCTVTGNTVHVTGAGSCHITASQAGNGNYNPASDVVRTFNITKGTTTTALSSSANPSAPGQNVTFTATVSGGGATPTGTVQFKVDNVNHGAPVALNASGFATFSTSAVTVGNHTVTADYSGDANFNASKGTLSGGQVVSINANITISDVIVAEGTSGTTNAAFTVTLSSASAVAVTVDFSTADGSGPGGATVADNDYQSANGTVTFNAGETTKTITVLVNGDPKNELNETFFVNLSNASNATISDNQGLGTINNDDTPGVQLSNSTYTVNEGLNNTPQGFTSLSVDVIRTGDISQPARVKYITSDTSGGAECNQVTGQASQRCDYNLVGATLRFAAGESTKTIQIPIINDGYHEGNEFFSIQLLNGVGITIGSPSQALVTIQDDAADATPTTSANNPYLNNSFFVRQNYLDFLGRDTDQAGFADWTNVLNTCGPEKGFLGAPFNCDRAHVAHGFFGSVEFIKSGFLIHRLFEVGMNRLPLYREFIPDMASLSGFNLTPAQEQLNMADYLEEFTSQQEFINRFQDLSAPAQAALFIEGLEQTAGVTLPATNTTLPGQPTQYGRQELINLRASGQLSLGETLKAFVEQKVVYDRYFQRGHVTMLYFAYLRRDPNLNDPNLVGWNDWVNVFTNGGQLSNGTVIQPMDIHHLIFGFIYAEEYRKRFGKP